MGGPPTHPPQLEHPLDHSEGCRDAGTWGPRAGAQYPQQEELHWTGACGAGGVRTPTPLPQSREVLKGMLSLALLQGAPPKTEPHREWEVIYGGRIAELGDANKVPAESVPGCAR